MPRQSTAAATAASELPRTTFLPKMGPQAVVVPLTRRDAARWSQALVHRAQDCGCEVKEIARAADCSPDAIKKIAAGRHAFSLTTLANLARAPGYEWLQPELRRLMTLEADLDPAFERAHAAFVQAFYAGRR